MRIVTEMKQVWETSEIIHFKKGLPQGDFLCPTLSTLCLNPIAWKLRATSGYKLSKPIVWLSECDKIAKWQFFLSRYIFLNQVFYIHGKFLYIHVKTIYSLSMRLASYQMFFFMSIYVHSFYTSRRTGDELGLDYGGVWEQTARETTWWRAISSFPMRKSFSHVSCLFSVNAPHARMCAMATKLSYYRDA